MANLFQKDCPTRKVEIEEVTKACRAATVGPHVNLRPICEQFDVAVAVPGQVQYFGVKHYARSAERKRGFRN